MPRNSAQVLQLDLKSAPRKETPEDVIRRIDECIRNPPVESIPFDIPPAVAEHVLKAYNVGNRSRKPAKINEYASDMLNGKWADTREPLKFSDAKVLRDGQNRLMACVRAGVPFRTYIAFGMPDAAFSKMDQGKTRSGSDLLQIAGYTNTSHLAPPCGGCTSSRQGASGSGTPTARRNRSGCCRNCTRPAELDDGRRTHLLPDRPAQGARLRPAPPVPQGEPAEGGGVVRGLGEGRDAGPFKPLALVTKRIAEIKVASQGPVQDLVRAALLVQAWNLFVAGKKGANGDIGWTMAEEFPAIAG